MLAHYTAASLTSENKGLCFPASSDSIPTSAGQEDHVSMGMTSARRASAALANTERVLAIEILSASQALEMRAPLQPAPVIRAVVTKVREVSAALDADRSLGPEIEQVTALIRAGALVETVRAHTPSLL